MTRLTDMGIVTVTQNLVFSLATLLTDQSEARFKVRLPTSSFLERTSPKPTNKELVQ